MTKFHFSSPFKKSDTLTSLQNFHARGLVYVVKLMSIFE